MNKELIMKHDNSIKQIDEIITNSRDNVNFAKKTIRQNTIDFSNAPKGIASYVAGLGLGTAASSATSKAIGTAIGSAVVGTQIATSALSFQLASVGLMMTVASPLTAAIGLMPGIIGAVYLLQQ
jgi:hypothetical protein